jgi:hypothetical protein
MTRRELHAVHQRSLNHREAVLASRQCGCFYCLALFGPDEIGEWIPEPGPDRSLIPGATGLCPSCGIDAVLPDSIPGAPLTRALLAEMNAHWFRSARRES